MTMMKRVYKNEYTIEMPWGTMRGIVGETEYIDGSPALVMLTDEGQEVLSVNLSEYGDRAPAGYIFVKNYSENEGLPDALETAGIAKKVTEVHYGPFNSSFWLMRVTAE